MAPPPLLPGEEGKKRPPPPPATQEGAGPGTGKRRALPAFLQKHRAPPPPPPPAPLREQQPQPQQQQQRARGPPPSLPFVRFTGALTYVSGDEQAREFDHEGVLLGVLAQADAAVAAGAGEGGSKPAVAIDLEWNVNFTARGGQPQGPGPAALLQLAALPAGSGSSRGGDVVVFLFHLAHLPRIPPVVRALLCHRGVRKVGVNVRGDLQKLGRDRAGDFGGDCGEAGASSASASASSSPWPAGFVELSHLANHVLASSSASSSLNPTQWSLDRLAQAVLGQQVAKPNAVRRDGDWTRRPLSHDQMNYAATDAYATLRCYFALAARLPPSKPFPVQEMGYTLPVPTTTVPPLSAMAAAAPSPTAVPPPAATAAGPLRPLPPSKHDAHYQFTFNGQSLAAIAAARGGIRVGTVGGYVAEAIAAGYPYDWGRVRHAILSGGADATAPVAGEEPPWMARARAVHAELLLLLLLLRATEEGGAEGQEQEAQQGSSSSSDGGDTGLPKMGRVWGVLKEEEVEVEYWRLSLLVAHLNREAAAASEARGGGLAGETEG